MKQRLIDENTAVAQAEELVAADMDGETVMMRIESGKYFGLDSVGSRIWSLIAEPRRVSQVIDKLLGEYEVERRQCREETMEFLHHLIAEGLVKIV